MLTIVFQNGSIKCERVSPVEIKDANKKQQNIHAKAVDMKPKGAISCGNTFSHAALQKNIY